MHSEPSNPFAPTPPATVPAAPYVHPPQPPLSIAHLLVWTAGSAVILGVGRAYFAVADFPESFRTYLNLQQFVGDGALHPAAITHTITAAAYGGFSYFGRGG